MNDFQKVVAKYFLIISVVFLPYEKKIERERKGEKEREREKIKIKPIYSHICILAIHHVRCACTESQLNLIDTIRARRVRACECACMPNKRNT